MRQDADKIIAAALHAVQPDAAVQRALAAAKLEGAIYLVATGKAAWQMAKAASDALHGKISAGVVVT